MSFFSVILIKCLNPCEIFVFGLKYLRSLIASVLLAVLVS